MPFENTNFFGVGRIIHPSVRYLLNKVDLYFQIIVCISIISELCFSLHKGIMERNNTFFQLLHTTIILIYFGHLNRIFSTSELYECMSEFDVNLFNFVVCSVA